VLLFPTSVFFLPAVFAYITLYHAQVPPRGSQWTNQQQPRSHSAASLACSQVSSSSSSSLQVQAAAVALASLGAFLACHQQAAQQLQMVQRQQLVVAAAAKARSAVFQARR
jgi:hypothetical protein